MPEDQLDEAILQYGEYIKVVIMVLVAIALVYFLAKWLIKRRRKIETED